MLALAHLFSFAFVSYFCDCWTTIAHLKKGNQMELVTQPTLRSIHWAFVQCYIYICLQCNVDLSLYWTATEYLWIKSTNCRLFTHRNVYGIFKNFQQLKQLELPSDRRTPTIATFSSISRNENTPWHWI